jgi:hypothetical protein
VLLHILLQSADVQVLTKDESCVAHALWIMDWAFSVHLIGIIHFDGKPSLFADFELDSRMLLHLMCRTRNLQETATVSTFGVRILAL